MQIGVAGCGQMGCPMAEAIQAAGFTLRGFDVREPVEFGDFASSMIDDPAAFGEETEVLFSIVRDIPQTEALLFGDQALLARSPALRTLVICSTVSPRYVADLRARVPTPVALIDAPMSGAPIAARERRLTFMLGGTQDDIAPLMPVFRAMGRQIHHLGPLGAGMTMKVLNNLVAASSVATTRLTLEVAATLGIGRDDLLAVMNDSSGQTWFGSNFEQIAFAREGFDPANTMGILRKDVESLIDALPAGADRDLPEAIIRAISGLRQID